MIVDITFITRKLYFYQQYRPNIMIIKFRATVKSVVIVYLIIVFSFYLNVQIRKSIEIKLDNPLAIVHPNMWGVFFEDINFVAGRGKYDKLIKNRSFEFQRVAKKAYLDHPKTFNLKMLGIGNESLG